MPTAGGTVANRPSGVPAASRPPVAGAPVPVGCHTFAVPVEPLPAVPSADQGAHGQPITRDALRARLGVSNQAASELLRQLRAGEGQPPGTSRAA